MILKRIYEMKVATEGGGQGEWSCAVKEAKAVRHP
jgi:hypothetical protein